MHSKNFKDEAVRQVVEFGYPVHLVSKRLKIPYQLLLEWMESSGHDSSELHEHSENSIQLENIQLKTELAKIKKERDELKRQLKSQERKMLSATKQNVA